MAGGGEVEAWVAERRPGWSLPRQLYLSTQAFERDMARVFMRGWSFVGHIARIPAVGDYFLHEIGDESIVVMRSGGGDTAVSAFFNVCRHRGSRICLEAEGHATSRLVCPYHAWSYTLEGELASARHMGAHFDRADMGLHRCAVRVVEGLIFLCPEPPGPDLGSFWDQMRALFAPHGFRQAKVARRTIHRIRANWKVFAENFWECYHCTHAHPEFCQVMSYPAAAESPRRRAEYERFVSDWRQRAQREGRLPVQVELSESKLYQLVRTPIRPGFLTQTRDGRPVAPLMGQFTQYDGAISAMQMFPLNWIVASNDHAMLFSFAPMSELETRAELTWLVDGDAVEGRDYDPAEVSWLWEVTNGEDWKICETNQSGVNSRMYRPGPYSEAEQGVEQFIEWYFAQIA